jgi:hypothetical protein
VEVVRHFLGFAEGSDARAAERCIGAVVRRQVPGVARWPQGLRQPPMVAARNVKEGVSARTMSRRPQPCRAARLVLVLKPLGCLRRRRKRQRECRSRKSFARRRRASRIFSSSVFHRRLRHPHGHARALIVIGLLRSELRPSLSSPTKALERFCAAAFSASLVEHSETDPFRAGLIHPLPTELASVGSTRLRGQGVDKSGMVILTKSGQARLP